MAQTVDFFFDFVSPYTYLAHTRVEGIAARTGATFRRRPMHLLNLMKQTGNSPTTLVCANKMKYAGADIGRWVSRYGVPFRFNARVFEADQSLALRGGFAAREAGCEDAYDQAIFRAFWADAVAVNDRAALTGVLDAAGLDGRALLSRADEAVNGERLEASTRLAAERGVFGSPTFVVGDELFFGNDRLDFLEERLAAGRTVAEAGR